MSPVIATPSKPKPPTHVAGIGASAGGLEAMLVMFARMRPTGRVAFIVAQHMADDGHSDLVVRLIQRESALPVMLAEHGARLLADRIVVIPAGRDGHVQGDTLKLCDPAPEHLSTPSVNALFSSIAESWGATAIGIILSGTGSDGTIGCRAIRAVGGLTLAQAPSDAKFDGMPDAAIRAKLIDEVLLAERIGDALALRFPGAVPAPQLPPLTGPVAREVIKADPVVMTAEHQELHLLITMVHEATGIDFSSYKEETMLRRLGKRKEGLGITSAEGYQAYIRKDPGELNLLQHLFLVSVSSFFRDRQSFHALERALASVIADKPAGAPIRVWVPGCASGDEPYTLAIILTELLADFHQTHPIRITATDLNPEALETAREGLYRKTAFKEVEDGLRERYFSPRGQHYEINPAIKACVTFEQRDVLAGTPPTDLDLISCRNLLIYMKSHLQDDLVKLFHLSLRPQGLLFIGQSESLSFIGNSLFGPIDHYHRLFRRRR